MSRHAIVWSRTCGLSLVLALAACGADADDQPADMQGGDAVSEAGEDAGADGNRTPGGADGDADLASPLPRAPMACGVIAARLRGEGEDHTCGSAASEDECTADDACGAGQICQARLEDGNVGCACVDVSCGSDADCAEGEACACDGVRAVTTRDLAGACGPGTSSSCAPRCVPAACRTSEDCGEGQVCAAHFDGCGIVQGYACWDRAASDCAPAAVGCSGARDVCRPLGAGGAWACAPSDTPPCD